MMGQKVMVNHVRDNANHPSHRSIGQAHYPTQSGRPVGASIAGLHRQGHTQPP